MMEPTERREIGERRRAALGPKDHMVRLEICRVRATRKPTRAITNEQCTSHRGRNRACFASDVEHGATRGVFAYRNQAAVAREPARGLDRKRWTVVDVTSL